MKSATEIDYRKRIARVVAAIITDTAAPHSLEHLAAVAHLSPFHFHRVYRAIAGESVATTVRRVRMAQAAERLAAGTLPVTDIALDVGYDSPQAFARAFRAFAGMSPREFQRHGRAWGGAPSRAAKRGTLEPDPLRVAIVEHPAVRVHALRHLGSFGTIKDTFVRLRRWRAERGVADRAHLRVGLSYDDLADEKGCRYYAGVVLPEHVAPSDGIEIQDVPAGCYASHRLIGPYGMIEPTFNVLFATWLPRSGYEPDDRPALELYRDGAGIGAADVPVTDLLIPIRIGGANGSPRPAERST